MSVVAITGHRNLTREDVKTIRLAMSQLLSDETIKAIYFGGARGADTEALRACLEFRTDQQPELVVVVPDRVEDQPYEAREWIGKADRVIELGNPITSSDGYKSYDLRNEYLVDVARKGDGFIVAFWNGKPSGTCNCVEYARVVDVPVQRVEVSGGSRSSNPSR